MKRIQTILTTRVISLLLLFACVSGVALAQAPEHKAEFKPLHFTGLINDYTPSDVSGGPYEMHGQWTMDINLYRSTADFAADMTMSDYAMNDMGMPDATKGGQGAHTHHIALKNVRIKPDMTGCPAYSPATTQGFQISDTVSLLTGNGGPAPFEPVPVVSKLQVCVSGGNKVLLSNLEMIFTGPATKHFGPQAIHGVVKKTDDDPR